MIEQGQTVERSKENKKKKGIRKQPDRRRKKLQKNRLINKLTKKVKKIKKTRN